MFILLLYALKIGAIFDAYLLFKVVNINNVSSSIIIPAAILTVLHHKTIVYICTEVSMVLGSWIRGNFLQFPIQQGSYSAKYESMQ